MRTAKLLLCSAVSATVLGLAAAPASAQTHIVLHDTGGVTGSAAEQGFAIAASYWESVLTNNVTIEFNVGFNPLGPGILGSTGTTLEQFVPMTDYYASLAANSHSALDAQAVANLQPLNGNGSVNVTVPAYFNAATHSGVTEGNGGRTAPDGTPISSTIAVASSNYQALNGDTAGIDGDITFSSTFAFDFDPSDGITAGEYDFIGVAIHEMGHALGFLSGAQDFDYSTGQNFPVDTYWWGYAGDLFRYVGGDLDWRFNQPAYFSIDGGATAFLGDSYWSTGEVHGDGWQASHWKAPGGCTNLVGIMNPYICDGQTDDITAEDLGFIDAIGWNVNVDVLGNPNYAFSTADVYKAYFDTSAVPEPATWGLMILGFGMVGGAMRRRSTKVAYAQ